MNASRCMGATGEGAGKGGSLAATALEGERMSRNDLIDIRVGEDETFSGNYVVITSYSIHYTKLYEEDFQFKWDARHLKLKTVVKVFFFQVFPGLPLRR